MQATLFWACAVAPKRLRFAHAQNDRGIARAQHVPSAAAATLTDTDGLV